MKIFLTGATGFLGHHLLPMLSSAGHECLALTRYKPGCRELQVLPRVTVQQASVFDDEALRAGMQGADAVINMVGILNEKGRNGSGFHRAHVELAEKLIAAARESGVRRFVQVSALGAGEGSSHYQASKGEAEERIRAAQDLDWTIFRPSVIFGAGDSFFNRFAALLAFAPVLPLACPAAAQSEEERTRDELRRLEDDGKTAFLAGWDGEARGVVAVAGEQPGLITAGAGPDLQKDVLALMRIFGCQELL